MTSGADQPSANERIARLIKYARIAPAMIRHDFCFCALSMSARNRMKTPIKQSDKIARSSDQHVKNENAAKSHGRLIEINVSPSMPIDMPSKGFGIQFTEKHADVA